MRNLHKVQAGRGVNAPGLPEIPEAVFVHVFRAYPTVPSPYYANIAS
jgi:hypothetical protein